MDHVACKPLRALPYALCKISSQKSAKLYILLTWKVVVITWMVRMLLIRYCCNLDANNVPEEVFHLANRIDAQQELVEKIVDIDNNENGIWLILPDKGDYTWSRITEMYKCIPEMAKTLLEGPKKVPACHNSPSPEQLVMNRPNRDDCS